jgi:hypothetical protein
MVLTIIIVVWLAIQLPLGALIGTLIERGMVQPRRREEARPVEAASVLLQGAGALGG